MKTMKINLNDTEKLEQALAEVQKGCRERTYTANDIQQIGKTMLETLKQDGVSRKAAVGCAASFGYGYDKPNAYKYAMMGTVGEIEVFPSGVFLTELKRWYCDGNSCGHLSDAAKEAILKDSANRLSY